ncbi:hypothetical protein Y1Q_0002816 [Alligator mississippiensis]|uniref:Uncharacterized protein n=1 Tax=Alligator mississippiensis TaxID=8496 RepID=A0A151P0L8_ALLMI|nr:hypothetical protein Y1Q_0002816 [Alligator mississippiensis]
MPLPTAAAARSLQLHCSVALPDALHLGGGAKPHYPQPSATYAPLPAPPGLRKQSAQDVSAFLYLEPCSTKARTGEGGAFFEVMCRRLHSAADMFATSSEGCCIVTVFFGELNWLIVKSCPGDSSECAEKLHGNASLNSPPVSGVSPPFLK